MKEILKSGSKVFLRLVIINIMGFILALSINVLFTGLFTDDIGYTAFGAKKDSSEMVELYRHYYSDGEDLKQSEYEQQGYIITKANIRSLLSGGAKVGFAVVTQLFNTTILFVLIYNEIWKKGNDDRKKIPQSSKFYNKLKGLKIGLVATTPYILFLAFLTITKQSISSNFSVGIYKIINASAYGFLDLVCDNFYSFADLKAVQIILLFLLIFIPVIITQIIYYLGYRDIYVGEKIVYKKIKKQRY